MKGYFVLLVVLFTGGCLYGQDYEAWLKRERAEREKFAKEEKAGLQKLQKEYDAFVEARDKEFSEFLKQRWKEYEMFAGKKRDAGVPKPKVSPVASAKQDVKTVLLRVENPGGGAFGCPGRQSGSSHEKKRFEAGAGVAGQLCFLRE